MTKKAAPQFSQVPTLSNTMHQQYNTTQLQYNAAQPHYNPVQYNHAPRGD
jgi:hypothetical protein